MQKPANTWNPTRLEFFGFSNFWPEKPETLLSKTRPDPDLNFRVRVFSRVFGYTMLDTLPTVREVWKFREHLAAAAHWEKCVCAPLQALSQCFYCYSAPVMGWKKQRESFSIADQDGAILLTTDTFLCNVHSIFLALFLLFSSTY